LVKKHCGAIIFLEHLIRENSPKQKTNGLVQLANDFNQKLPKALHSKDQTIVKRFELKALINGNAKIIAPQCFLTDF